MCLLLLLLLLCRRVFSWGQRRLKWHRSRALCSNVVWSIIERTWGVRDMVLTLFRIQRTAVRIGASVARPQRPSVVI
ncbi:hypothetical protein BJV77DRAFT_992474 [Russula vinacea]|nr:hypothetical protein BJV77DRAFT_992474 [Russula vinacea]